MGSTFLRALVVLAVLWFSTSESRAVPPAYDHVVIVIEENEQYQAIIGNLQAPYINSLASGGVSFTNMHAIVHPSQPNYLEFYSGSNQGVTGDGSVFSKFTTPNLGASLIAAGSTFAGYAEGLPSVGDITSDNVNDYVQRHCPWINWMPSGSTLGANQISKTLHKPFFTFPTDYTQLPTVSFVIPNNRNNMHTGTIAAADLWLQTNLSGYAEWAKTHNSLLIVTWDEDSFQQANRIPTIFYGANLLGFPNEGAWSLHNVLRMLEDMYALPPSGRVAQVPPIVGSFLGEPALITKEFSASAPGAGSIEDTMISSVQPDGTFGSAMVLQTRGGSSHYQSLIKFNNIFGPAGNQIPINANVVSAKLVITTSSDSGATSVGTMNLHRMLVPWTGLSTFNSLVNGIQTDGVEAVAAAEFSAVPSFSRTAVVFDTTVSMGQFQGGTPNEGWLLNTASTDNWLLFSSENSAYFPILEVTYTSNDTIGFDQPEYVVTPGGVEAHVSVHHFGAAATPLAVDYSTSDLSAIAGSDYTSTTGTLTWAVGDLSSRTVVIPITLDSVIEGDETFRVSLSNIVGVADLDANSTTNVRISERPFDNWRFSFFGPEANDPKGQPNADPDDDAQSNFQEYMFAANPTVPNQVSIVPEASMVGGTLYFQFRQNLLANDLTYKVQISEDLATWIDGCVFSSTESIYSTPTMEYYTSENFPGYNVIHIRSLMNSTTGRVFMRLNVTLNP
jgi:acid phosphatase